MPATPDLPTPDFRFDPVAPGACIAGVRPYRNGSYRLEAETIANKFIVHNYGHGGCGITLSWGCAVKVRDIVAWDAPAAALIHARALLLAHRTVSRSPVYSDTTWASVYRAGDYCMPHSHLRSNLSIVYMLDPGDGDASDAMAGRLCFADPSRL